MSKQPTDPHQPSRRAALAAGAVGAMTPLALLGRAGAQPVNEAPPSTDQGPDRMPAAAKPDYVFDIEQKTIAPLGTSTEAILVNGTDPGILATQ